MDHKKIPFSIRTLVDHVKFKFKRRKEKKLNFKSQLINAEEWRYPRDFHMSLYFPKLIWSSQLLPASSSYPGGSNSSRIFGLLPPRKAETSFSSCKNAPGQ